MAIRQLRILLIVHRRALSHDVLDCLDNKFGLITLNIVAASCRFSKFAIFRSAN